MKRIQVILNGKSAGNPQVRSAINLDGEPYRWDWIRFDVRPRAIRVVLPEGCPLIQGV
jgi:diacylglycerol kinase family enzyme